MEISTSDQLVNTISATDDQELAVQIIAFETRQVLRLRGTINFYLAEDLHRAVSHLLDAETEVVIDWEHAAHFDACALQLLLALQAGLAERGKVLRATELNPQVKKILNQAGLTNFFTMAAQA